MFYKRNTTEAYAWLLVAKTLPLPLEMAVKVCQYLFDKIPCPNCGIDEYNHSMSLCRVLPQVSMETRQAFINATRKYRDNKKALQKRLNNK